MDMGMRTVHCAMSLTWLRATCQGAIVLAFSSVYVVLLVVCLHLHLIFVQFVVLVFSKVLFQSFLVIRLQNYVALGFGLDFEMAKLKCEDSDFKQIRQA